MSTPAESSGVRGTRYALLTVFFVGLRRRNPGAVVNAVAAAAGTYLPDFIARAYGVELEPWQRAYVNTAMLTHAVGMLGPYDEVWWWDHLTHAHSSSILGGLIYAVSRRRGRDPGPRVVAVVVCLGLGWELLEYVIHTAANRLGLEPILVTYGPKDTALDIVFDLVGAVLVLAFGDCVLGEFEDGE
ncbi:hypothetical protein Htur_4349 (plasmid) [Haloterrigena turkmenica DSM 5511]|uniref:Uncharacterized protein n=1 Tax=Haloterrigena turkmenica (strain ATCC 51198 / DSM 5511 / JCM 9101 / NCIMB 13204 / VKM B-1734 / 4k) TaxID=543526 RepID=D2S1B6_HALTV|nr:hypothetical protein [Haloterrigena turkmenica]ADB63163.1 hypothetical protein Htur_4349 [Haloterrigena turkmenica DSM 5511]